MDKSSRIDGFDFARAFAIFGMMLVNYKIVFTKGCEWNLFFNDFISLFEGRAASVFLILAGVGISLMSKKALESKSKELRKKINKRLIKRSLFLFVFGMWLYLGFDWNADILHYYGVYMLLTIFFLYKDKKFILISIILILIISTIFQINMDYTTGWNNNFTLYKDFNTLKGFTRNLFFNGYHPIFPWFSFFLIGILFGRINFYDEILIKNIASKTLIIGILTEFISYSIINLNNYSQLIVYLFDTKPLNPTVFYIVSGASWAISFICFCVLISKYLKKSKIFKALVATGQMALTHYFIHCVIVLGLFFVIDKLSYRDEGFVILLSLIVFVLMTVFSHNWLKFFKRGPLELVMRKLS
ncbi:DUF418 domain-containing protein [Peptostreptococcaceae bacterium AGR-M142]